MANGETANDLHLEILKRCGEVTDGTSDFHHQALIYLNKCYQKIISGSSEFELDIGEPWPWAKSTNKIVLKLLPQYNTGRVSFTFNSSSGTFSSIPQINATNVSLQGYWINTTAQSEWYQIASHISGSTSFTLDGTFNDTTATNSTFIACLLDYTLTAVGTNEVGGIQRLAAPMEVSRVQKFDNDNEFKIYGVDIREMRRQYPLSLVELGVPTRFGITSQTDGVITIRFNKYCDLQTRAEVEYIPVPIDLTSNPNTVPVIPREFRDVLIYGPSHWLMLDKADDRAPSYLQMTQAILKAMIMDSRKKRDHVQKQKAGLIPRWDLINQRKRILYY